MSKKSKTILILAIILIIAVVAIVLNKKSKPNEVIPTVADQQINQAIQSDTTIAINKSIDSINVDDTSSVDMKGIDSELKNL